MKSHHLVFPFFSIFQIFLFCLILPFLAKAQDGSQSKKAIITEGNDSTKIGGKLQPDDFKKFFIGFTKNSIEEKTITLQINSINTKGDNIKFKYTMNTFNAKEEGDGKIFMEINRIELMDGTLAKFYLSLEGKIIIEALESDSSNFFLLKEN
jgi:hypothetical protein